MGTELKALKNAVSIKKLIRFLTYQMGKIKGATSIATKFPSLLGFGKNQHSLAHGWNKPGGAEAPVRWDRFRAEQLSYFLHRLRKSSENEGALLYHTMDLYGGSNSITHNNTNYPLVVAGGDKLGLKHGLDHRFGSEFPLPNLLVTRANRLGMSESKFIDSKNEITEIIN